jgi:hypothetical protein
MRESPSDGLFDFRAGLVDKIAEMVEDRLGKRGRAGDISVDTIVGFH